MSTVPAIAKNFLQGYRAGFMVLVHKPMDPQLVWRIGRVVFDPGGQIDIEFVRPDNVTYAIKKVFPSDILLGYRSDEDEVQVFNSATQKYEEAPLSALTKACHQDVAGMATLFASFGAKAEFPQGAILMPYKKTLHKVRAGSERKPNAPTKSSFKAWRIEYKKTGEVDCGDLMIGRRSAVYRLAIDLCYDAFCEIIGLRYSGGKHPPHKKDFQKFFYEQSNYFRDMWIKMACKTLQIPWWKHTEVVHLHDFMTPDESRAYHDYLEKRKKK